MQRETCRDCGAIVLVALVEPEAKPMRFDSQPRRLWRMVEVSPSYFSAVATDVFEAHVATCSAINRNGPEAT